MGISTSSSEITGSASLPRSLRPRLEFRLRNRSRPRRPPWPPPSRSSSRSLRPPWPSRSPRGPESRESLESRESRESRFSEPSPAARGCSSLRPLLWSSRRPLWSSRRPFWSSRLPLWSSRRPLLLPRRRRLSRWPSPAWSRWPSPDGWTSSRCALPWLTESFPAAAGPAGATAGAAAWAPPAAPSPPPMLAAAAPLNELSPIPPALALPTPGCDVSNSMASCSKWRVAPAPAGAPR